MQAGGPGRAGVREAYVLPNYEALLKYGPSPIHRKTFLKNLEDHRK